MSDTTRRIFLGSAATGLVGAGTALAFNAGSQPSASFPALNSEFLLGIGQEFAKQVSALQSGATREGQARAFATTLRVQAWHFRQSGHANILQDMVRVLQNRGHLTHAQDPSSRQQMRQRAYNEFEKTFGVNAEPLFANVPRRSPDTARIYADIARGVQLPDQLVTLADALDANADRIKGLVPASFLTQGTYQQWCETFVCNPIWLLGEAWAAACSLTFLFPELAFACALLFIEYEQARFFAWIIGCDC